MDHIFEYINAITSDRDLADLLKQILSQPEEERLELLINLSNEAKASGAPAHFIDFLLVLQDLRIAEKVSEFLAKKG